MHHAADIFAHSAYGLKEPFKDKRITHTLEGEPDTKYADNTGYINERYQAAIAVVKNALSHLDKSNVKGGEQGSLQDFALTPPKDEPYNSKFYLGNFLTNAKEVCNTSYFKETFNEKYKNLAKASK